MNHKLRAASVDMQPTIFALSSGGLPSGIAVIRVSGPRSFDVASQMCGREPVDWGVALSTIRHPTSQTVLDHGLVIGFNGPNSFTGEDVVEFHCHGGVATVSAVLDALTHVPGLKHAEAGEFSRRAFENGKMDLTQVEGLADLISAQTEEQRLQALGQAGGNLRALYENWRHQLIRYRALVEAELDFSDEDGVPGSVSDQVWEGVSGLSEQIMNYLDDQNLGEIVRNGFRIALLGPPNSGKSSLLNALAKRDVAIVTDEAGTTRDVLSVNLDINGMLTTISDTAGLRETDNKIEKEGIRRALQQGSDSDLVIWLCPADEKLVPCPFEKALVVRSKMDLVADETVNQLLGITTAPGLPSDGLVRLLDIISDRISLKKATNEHPVATRKRHKDALSQTLFNLNSALDSHRPIELRSEDLRIASEYLGRLTGRIDVEDLLDVIFGEFCIGK